MSGLWRNRPDTPEGKYLVQRRDGSIPRWPWFVLGANDPAAVAALRAYVHKAWMLKMDPEYCVDVRKMAWEWEALQTAYGTTGDPDAGPDLIDDPATIEMMRQGLLAAENAHLRELLRRALIIIERTPGAACLEVEMNKALEGDRSPDQESAP